MTTGRARPSFTVVSFHAHPDDEALLTAGTLARAVVEGHRVVIVVATAGEAGLAEDDPRVDLGARRRRELAESAGAIGAHRVEVLGYADSGPAPSDPIALGSFSQIDPEAVARRLASILDDERADVLTSYDSAGGYGHPDHRQVHRVGRLAAEMAGTPLVLEATLDRALICRVARGLRTVGRLVPMFEIPDLSTAYTAREDLTHRVDVRPHLSAKLAALRAHASQATGGPRTLGLLLRLHRPIQRAVLGHEWFREVGRTPDGVLLDNMFTTLELDPEHRRSTTAHL